MSLKMLVSEMIASSNSEDVSQAQAWLIFVVRSRHGLIQFLTGLGAQALKSQDVKTSSNSGAQCICSLARVFGAFVTMRRPQTW